MNPRIIALALVLFTITSASALSIIGATDSEPGSYDYTILEEILILADTTFDIDVDLNIKTFTEVTNADLEESIVILIRDGRVLFSIPESVEVMLTYYVEQLETWVGPYLPYTTKPALDIIEEGIDEQFAIGCFKSDSGIYEAGVTTGRMHGQTLPATYEDLCIADLLIEYACENDRVIRLEIPCDAGCVDGACIQSSTQSEPTTTEPDYTGEYDDVELEPGQYPTRSGERCTTYWHWTPNGFICHRPDLSVEEVVIEAPPACIGCVSGERCIPHGDRLPDNRTCTGIGFTCLGCDVNGGCVPNRASTPDGRLCIAGELHVRETLPEPEVIEPVRERQPIEELFAPEPASQNRGLLAIIGDFFRNLFGR